MKSFSTIATIVCGLLAVCLYLSAWLTERRDRAKGGFQEWLKNPKLKDAASRWLARRKALHVPDDISDREIRKLVKRLFVESDDDFDFDRLKLVGRKAIPHLIEALNDPRIKKSKFSAGQRSFLDSSTLERICNLLEPFGPPEAVSPLLRFIDHPDDDFRGLVSMALGNIGIPECIEPVLKSLADPEKSVWSSAMAGIREGCDGQRSCQEFRDAVFPHVANRLLDEEGSLHYNTPETLLAIDRDRATSILLSEKIANTKNYRFYVALSALNEAGCRIPHAFLLPLLNRLQPLSHDYPHDCDYAEALIAYAHNPDSSAEERFRLGLQAGNQRVILASAEALAICAGIPDASTVVLNKKRELGFEALSDPQQLYYAAFSYAAEVTNGGHAQFFVNSSGAKWKTVLRALKTVGAVEIEKIFQEAVAVFGPGEPSADNDARHCQLARFSKAQNEALRSLDKRYQECRESLEGLLLLFAIDHKEHFSTPSKP